MTLHHYALLSAVAVVGILVLANVWMHRRSQWPRLVQRFPLTFPCKISRPPSSCMGVGGVWCRGVVRMAATEQGLVLKQTIPFSLWSRSVCVPWDQIAPAPGWEAGSGQSWIMALQIMLDPPLPIELLVEDYEECVKPHLSGMGA